MELNSPNFQIFRDCLAGPLIQKSSTTTTSVDKRTRKGGRKGKKNGSALREIAYDNEGPSDADELAEFIDYIASEIFSSFPGTVQTMTYSQWLNNASLQTIYPFPLPLEAANDILRPLSPSIAESLTTYSLLPPSTTLTEFLLPVLTNYHETITTPPPSTTTLREAATECEICERAWIPLTFHHLIPKEVHAKVLKRGWHTEDVLNDPAWLCRACHNFIHSCATNEELARDYYTVEKLLARDDVQKFRGWIGKVRWKAR